MKTAIIVKSKEANRIIVTPKISSYQIFKIVSLIMNDPLEKSNEINDDNIRCILTEIGLEDFEIVEIAAELNYPYMVI